MFIFCGGWQVSRPCLCLSYKDIRFLEMFPLGATTSGQKSPPTSVTGTPVEAKVGIDSSEPLNDCSGEETTLLPLGQDDWNIGTAIVRDHIKVGES
ncbi:MAG: hypothetical protein ACO20X_10115 [Alphaproteobacteria bacterium]|nr:hypothetical protein [Alphaproteobacteria bacterium]